MTLVVVTGRPGTGKTTLCRDLARLARARGLTVCGLLTVAPSADEGTDAQRRVPVASVPIDRSGAAGGGRGGSAARDSGGRRRLERPAADIPGVQRLLEDLDSGVRRLLGSEVPLEQRRPGDPRWRLVDDTLAWGDAVLRAACPSDVLIVDEAGPVELLHQRGWLAGMRQALGGPFALAAVVVRPWLVPRFLDVIEREPEAAVPVILDVEDHGAAVAMHGFLEQVVADRAATVGRGASEGSMSGPASTAVRA